MERLLNLVRGCAHVEVTGAVPTAVLNHLAAANVEFWDAEAVDTCTIRLTLRSGQLERAEAIAKRCLCELHVVGRRGAPVIRQRLRRRKVLVACVLACLLTLGCSSLFIWDIEVVGNETVSDGEILRALEDCGVGIGAFWPSLSNELIRNEMILKIPEISWTSVNVSHSRAVVGVRERREKPEIIDNHAPVDVVARTTGIITKLDVRQGRPLVEVGDAVLEGETIVTGYVESSYDKAGSRCVHAIANAEAATWYEMTAKAPVSEAQKVYTGDDWSSWSVILGDRRINIFGSSRKEGRTCDKITYEYPFSMEGVFAFPITIVRERCTEYTLAETAQSTEAVEAELQKTLTAALDSRLDGRGEVVSASFASVEKDGYIIVTLRAECREDIAVEVEFTPPANEGENLVNDGNQPAD